MKQDIRISLSRRTRRSGPLAVATVLGLFALAGCKHTLPPVDDATLTTNVHNAIAADSTIANQTIQDSVLNGVVTLTGNVSNDTARLVAGDDAIKVPGVKQVVNDLTIQGIAIAPTITTTAAPSAPRVATREERQAIARHESLPPPPSGPPESAPAPPQQQANLPPPPPPAPVYRDLHVPPGAGVSVRITQTLDSATTQPDTSFSGVVTNPVIVNGEVAIPAGASVSGRVIDVKDAAHFKGSSLLSIELTGIRRRGESIAVNSEPYTVQGKGRGTNTAEKVGGGAAVGAILGGIFGGGKGAAIGAGAGAGVGAGAQGLTRGQQVQITSESVVRFRLANGFTVRSMGPTTERDEDNDNNGGLRERQPQ